MDTDATKAPRPDAAWKEVLQDAMDEIVNMAKENYELKERIKRLEEAGDAMAAWLLDPRNLGGGSSMASQWYKAKEAKP